MSWVGKTFKSSVGQKFLVGLTGFLLIGFLVIHLIGNLAIYIPEAHATHEPGINTWATLLHTLAEGLFPLLLPMEVGLIGLFVIHMGIVIKLTLKNQEARGPEGYKVTGTKSKDGLSNTLSKLMLPSGLVIGAFLVVHLMDVFTVYKGHEHELHATLVDNLSGGNAWKAVIYILGTVAVGLHLAHGFQSALRSFGLNNDKYTPALTTLGKVIGVVMGLAFASIPLLIVAGVVQ